MATISVTDQGNVSTYFVQIRNTRRIKLANKNQWHCYWCNHGMCPEFGFQNSATIEHLVPRSLGGSDRIDNLQSACARCNRIRGIQDHDEFMQIAKTFTKDRRSIQQAELDRKALKKKEIAKGIIFTENNQLNAKQRRRKEFNETKKAFNKSRHNPFDVNSRKYKMFEKLCADAPLPLTMWQKIYKLFTHIFPKSINITS